MKKKNIRDLCIHCGVETKKSFVNYRGLKLDALECPKCREKTFTERQTLYAIRQVEASSLKKEYAKHPVRIGHSWGILFPKAVSKIFGLDKKSTELRIRPLIKSGKIELLISAR